MSEDFSFRASSGRAQEMSLRRRRQRWHGVLGSDEFERAQLRSQHARADRASLRSEMCCPGGGGSPKPVPLQETSLSYSRLGWPWSRTAGFGLNSFCTETNQLFSRPCYSFSSMEFNFLRLPTVHLSDRLSGFEIAHEGGAKSIRHAADSFRSFRTSSQSRFL